MSDIHRINLSFDLDREIDRRVYQIIMKEHAKTAYIIRKILLAEGLEERLDKETIKQAVREALSEANLQAVSSPIQSIKKNEPGIPDSVFEIFEQL